MEPKTTGKRVHITMGDGYPKDGSVRPLHPSEMSTRIVSKGTYVKTQADRILGGSFGALFVFLAALCALLTFCGCIGVIACFWIFHAEGVGFACGCLMCTVLTGGVAYLLHTTGRDLVKEATETDPGIPLTRANIADLSAPDILVRASEEPRQAHETVLLRAAIETAERHEEQLVRASVGGTE